MHLFWQGVPPLNCRDGCVAFGRLGFGRPCKWGDHRHKLNWQILCKQYSFNTKLIHPSLLPSFLDIPVLQPWRRGRLGHANYCEKTRNFNQARWRLSIMANIPKLRSNITGRSWSHKTRDTNKISFLIHLIAYYKAFARDFSLFPVANLQASKKKIHGMQWVNILYLFRLLKMTLYLMNR